MPEQRSSSRADEHCDVAPEPRADGDEKPGGAGGLCIRTPKSRGKRLSLSRYSTSIQQPKGKKVLICLLT